MQTKDHLALGLVLADRSGNWPLAEHRLAFLLGCAAPDWNVLTYLRGARSRRRICGHNFENSLRVMERSLLGVQRDGLRTAVDFFRLGKMLHYAADAFTWPHNDFWEAGIRAHRVYEAELHRRFRAALADDRFLLARDAPGLLAVYYNRAHRAYARAERGMETDCRFIIRVCGSLLASCLDRAAVSFSEFYPQEVNLRESAYHHGLV